VAHRVVKLDLSSYLMIESWK